MDESGPVSALVLYDVDPSECTTRVLLVFFVDTFKLFRGTVNCCWDLF
jgi:hypothetical protein